MKLTPLNRILLLATGMLAAYQIAVGIDGLDLGPVVSFTVSFGILLVASLLLMILGYEMLETPWAVSLATIIPLGLSLGLIWQHIPGIAGGYLAFTILGLSLVIITRLYASRKVAALSVAMVHGVAGLVIFVLPIILALLGSVRPGFALVGIGGAFIGVGGLLLSWLKAGKPILTKERILVVLPGLLLLMMAAFVGGFASA
jgi:hypothetical protein